METPFQILADKLKQVDPANLTKEQADALIEAIAGSRAICKQLEETAESTRKKGDELYELADQMDEQIADLDEAISVAEDLIAERAADDIANDMSGLAYLFRKDK